MGAGGTPREEKVIKPAPVQKTMSSAKTTEGQKKKILKKKKVTPPPATSK